MGVIMDRSSTAHGFAKSICFIVALTLGGACSAQPRTCMPKDAEAADAAVDSLDSWAKVASTFKKYGHCDDGSIAEANSEAIARLLVDHWDMLPALASLARRDPALRAFVLRHIDSTLDTDDLDRVRESASSQCPRGIRPFCSDLMKAASRASN